MPSDVSTFHALIFVNKVLERKYENMRISLFSSYFELLYPQISQFCLLPMLGYIYSIITLTLKENLESLSSHRPKTYSLIIFIRNKTLNTEP